MQAPGTTFRPAVPNDIEAIRFIVADAQATLAKNGIPQWQNGYPNSEVLLADIKKGESYVLENAEGTVIATLALVQGKEPVYAKIDGAWLTDGTPYLTIHRIALAPAAKGTGAAMALYTYIEALAKDTGMQSIRVDTHEVNAAMRAYLAKCGFTHCGTVYLADGAPRFAYEKVL